MSKFVSKQSTKPPAGQTSAIAVTDVPRSGVVRFLLPASIVMSFLAASSVPTPLYATYAREFHFSPITTTVIFGAYAIAVLVALLILGRVSDHIGRRPVLLIALAVQIGAAVVLATAGGVDTLLIGRVLQGAATGASLGALGAALLDVDPVRGALANSAVPGLGTGLGSLVSGLLVQYVPAPTHVVYLVLIGVFIVQGVGVAVSTEKSCRKPGLRAALVPKIGVPQGIRGRVLAAAPILFAVWALSGLYGSLGPVLARQLTGSTSALVGGLPFFLLAVISSLAAIGLSRVSPRAVMLCGIAGTIVAAVATLVAVELSSLTGFFASVVVAGFGFGAGLQGAFRTVMPQTAPHDRAGVLSVLYVVSYCGMGIPAIIAGVLVVDGGGLVSSAHDYSLFLIVLAIAALTGLLLTTRSRRHREDTPPAA